MGGVKNPLGSIFIRGLLKNNFVATVWCTTIGAHECTRIFPASTPWAWVETERLSARGGHVLEK
eukprot:4682199-Pyramimonas_sp.AAC.1